MDGCNPSEFACIPSYTGLNPSSCKPSWTHAKHGLSTGRLRPGLQEQRISPSTDGIPIAAPLITALSNLRSSAVSTGYHKGAFESSTLQVYSLTTPVLVQVCTVSP